MRIIIYPRLKQETKERNSSDDSNILRGWAIEVTPKV